jgi:hypothetical protein
VSYGCVANERTFLAYLRTSLSLVTVGVAVTQLFRLNTNNSNSDGQNKTDETSRATGAALGPVFVAIGLLFIVFGNPLSLIFCLTIPVMLNSYTCSMFIDRVGTVRYFYSQALMVKGITI